MIIKEEEEGGGGWWARHSNSLPLPLLSSPGIAPKFHRAWRQEQESHAASGYWGRERLKL